MEERLNEMEAEIAKCKLRMNDRIEEVFGIVMELKEGHMIIENALEEHAVSREEKHIKLESSLKELTRWFQMHDKNEMDKYDELASSNKIMSERYAELTDEIKALIVITRDNSNYIESEQAEQEKKKAVEEALAEARKPDEDLRKKREARLEKVKTAIWVAGGLAITGFLVNLTWWGLKFVFSPTGQAILEEASRG